MEIQTVDQKGSKNSKIKLSDKVFSQPFNEDLVHQLLTTYISNNHKKTKGQKNRSLVRGGGKKPWRQKGTGRARAGTIRSPIWRGGGVTFAHSYRIKAKKKINKKMYKSAMRSIWSKLIKEKKIIALSKIEIGEPPKSSKVKKILNDLDIKKAVFVLDSQNEVLDKATKNIAGVDVQMINSINPSVLINAEKVVITSQAVDLLEKNYS